MPRKLSHYDKAGRARMVDVSAKASTARVARAEALVRMNQTTLAAIYDGAVAKGDVLAVARVAGIQGAKRTAELVPLCHPLALTSVVVDFVRDDERTLRILTECRVTGQTGVEMEALTAASIAALTVYDMCKSADRGMTIECVRLLHKSGGKSGAWNSVGTR